MLINQNAAGSKVDYYLHRHLNVAVRVEPDDRALPNNAAVETKVTVTLDNRAPNSGTAIEAIGPFGPDFLAGENRTFVSLYTNHEFTKATIEDNDASLESARELGRHVYSSYVDVQSNEKKRFAISLAGGARLAPGGWYSLHLAQQPTVIPDEAAVAITLPSGWRIAETKGMQLQDRRSARAQLLLDRDTTVSIRVVRDGERGFWDELRGKDSERAGTSQGSHR
jgi:hypothetical protein